MHRPSSLRFYAPSAIVCAIIYIPSCVASRPHKACPSHFISSPLAHLSSAEKPVVLKLVSPADRPPGPIVTPTLSGRDRSYRIRRRIPSPRLMTLPSCSKHNHTTLVARSCRRARIHCPLRLSTGHTPFWTDRRRYFRGTKNASSRLEGKNRQSWILVSPEPCLRRVKTCAYQQMV